jgi:hypothetical protein
MGRLAPIFKLVAKRNAGKRFDPSRFAKEVGELYFIEVHPWAAEDLAPRLERAGLLKVVASSAAGLHEYVYAEVEGEFTDVTEADIKLVVYRFIDFSKPLLASHSLPIDEKGLEGVFFEQLIKMDFHAILSKREQARAADASADTLTIKKSPERVQADQALEAKARLDVLCASFILYVYREHRDIYDLLVRIAGGGMFAETVLNLQDPGASVSLEKLIVVLDAPFLMGLMDLASEEKYDYAQRLCKSLVEHGATLGAFRHSAEEVRDNLTGVIALTQEGGGFGPTARRLRSASFHEYAVAVKENPEASIASLGIRTVAIPTSNTLFQYFTEEDESAFFKTLGLYANIAAQRRDAASIAAVIRHRSGKRVRMANFHQTNYLFLTENPMLAARAREYMISAKLLATGEVPAAVTDRYLAGLLLVLYGGKAAEFTQYRLLANCASALEARTDVTGRMHRFLDQLGKPQADRFRALMTVERGGQHLMQLTLGSSTLVTDANAAQILEKVETVLIEKEQRKFDEKLNQLQKERDADAASFSTSRKGLENEILDARTKALLVSTERDEAVRRTHQAEEALRLKVEKEWAGKVQAVQEAMRFAVAAERVCLAALGIVVASLAGFFTWLGMQTRTEVFRIFVACSIAVLVFVGFWQLPEILFGRFVRTVRGWAFNAHLSVLGHSRSTDGIELDWKAVSARRRA